MVNYILWSLIVVFGLAWLIVLLRFRSVHGIWKTKRDFDYDELDKLLATQDYKFEVGKYLHKYKSDRRWYENRMVRWIVFLLVLTVLLLVAVLLLIFKPF
jgi:type II secretory pathway component PulL